ncbi:hypothetical protein EBZ37_04990 [bacterium]|nr:hypothetical protein [bacterium]
MGQPLQSARRVLATTLAIGFIIPVAVVCQPLVLAEDEVAVAPPPRPTDRQRLTEIQSIYAKAQYSRVLELVKAFEEEFPSSSKIPEVLNLKGLALLLTKDPKSAAVAFQAALSRAPDALLGDRNWKNYVRYNYAAALLETTRASEAEKELQLIDPEILDTANRLKYYQLKSRCFEKLGNIPEAIAIWITLDRKKEDFKLASDTILTTVERLLSLATPQNSLSQVEKQSEGSSFHDQVLFRSIQLFMEQGRSTEARDQLRIFLEMHPNSPKSGEAAALLRGMRQGVTTGAPSLGLLLPLKGRFAHISQKVIQSASLALGIFGPNTDQKIDLVIEDSGDDAESALAALNRLYSKHRVAAVLGPILSKGASAVIQRSEELAIPLVSLAQQQSENLGEFSSQAAIGPALQTRELARQAIQVMGLKRFAILAPKDKFGAEYSHHFWSAVDQLGGTVTAYETYDSGETDFRKPVDRLSGLFYPDARERELKALADEREQNQIKKKTRKTEKFFNLTPVVDFDAVFIADEPKTASFALPTFTYRDVDQVKFLGLSSWNSNDLIQRAQKAANGAVFMDAYYPLARSPQVRDFADKFRGTFGQEASSFDAVVFDAALTLARIISSESKGASVDRARVAAAIRQIRDATGVTGKITVNNGIWTRDLRALTIRESEVTEWAPTPTDPKSKPATSAD